MPSGAGGRGRAEGERHRMRPRDPKRETPHRLCSRRRACRKEEVKGSYEEEEKDGEQGRALWESSSGDERPRKNSIGVVMRALGEAVDPVGYIVEPSFLKGTNMETTRIDGIESPLMFKVNREAT